MKILFITQYFYPEIFRGNDIAFDLSRENEVTVVTAVPNYPKGTFFHGYGIFEKNYEIIKGVKVIRVPVVPRGNSGSVNLFLNYFSYIFFASIYIIKLAFNKKYDFVFVQQLSPVTVALPGILYKKLRKVPLYLWVLDLWPESLQSAGKINNKIIMGFFDKIVKTIYKNSTKILISSRGFRKSIIDKGANENKIVYFPNWAEDVFFKSHHISDKIPQLLSGFRIMFAGNIGEAQDFQAVMQAALLLKTEKKIKFIIIGDGRKRKWVESYIAEHQLTETVQILGSFPLNSMPSFFEMADVMLVSLKDELVFNLTIPAKIQAYMASSKPVIAMLNGEGKIIIQEAKCGVAVNAGDYKSLVDEILKFQQMSPEMLEEFGNNGNIYCKNNFDKQSCLNNLYKICELN